MTALSSFRGGDAPAQSLKFHNFSATAVESFICGRIASVLSPETFARALTESLIARNVPADVAKADERIKSLIAAILEIYEGVTKAESIDVFRYGDGRYQFRRIDGGSQEASEREARVAEALARTFPNGNILIRGSNYGVTFGVPEVDAALAMQLPRVISFDSAYRLLEDLPGKLDLAIVANPPNRITAALISFLGETELREFLEANDPQRKRDLEGRFLERLRLLASAVAAGKGGNPSLLQFDVYDLGLTAMVDGKKGFYHHLSDATKLLVAYHLFTRTEPVRDCVLLFDEPSTGLHASVQPELLRFLRNLAADGNQVVVSTHSEHMIATDLLPSVRIMRSDEHGHLRVENHPYSHQLGQADRLALQPVLDAIGLRLADRLDVCDELLVVEGVTELLYLRAFGNLLHNQPAVKICPARGEATIPSIASILISQGLGFKVLLDAGGTARRVLQEEFGMPDECLEEVSVPEAFANKTKGAGIEDLFSRGDFRAVLQASGMHIDEARFEKVSNAMYAKDIAKRVVAERVLAGVGRDEWAFDEETLGNFRSVLTFGSNGPWFRL